LQRLARDLGDQLLAAQPDFEGGKFWLRVKQMPANRVNLKLNRLRIGRGSRRRIGLLAAAATRKHSACKQETATLHHERHDLSVEESQVCFNAGLPGYSASPLVRFTKIGFESNGEAWLLSCQSP